MTQTKNIAAVVFVVALFGIILTMPQASEARVDSSVIGQRIKTSLASSTASSTRPTADISCVQTAVQERETAIIESWTGFSSSTLAALTVRKNALVEAWKLTDAKERASALKDLWKNWKESSKKAHTTLRADRKAAWAEFKQTMKTECRVTSLPKEDAEPKDTSGAVTI
jgi:hypothetical protein